MDDYSAQVAQANRLIDDEPRSSPSAQGTVDRLERLCSVLSRVLPAAGVGVSLLTEDHRGGGTVAASDMQSRVLEELQFSLGEGPCIDAHTSRRPILEPDLDVRGARRWPGYAPAAHQRGIRAIFAFPLQVGAARAGAMDIYRAQPGSLTPQAFDQAFTFADVAMGLLLDGQTRADGEASDDAVDGVLANRLEVYQAQGMLMVDLGVSIDEAMVRLRAYSYSEERTISAVASDIVAGKLFLERDTI